ncbi:MAG TPA: hypothetical protein VF139_07845 [Candidatus Polarisedimenticolaceae bacterium]
MFASTVLALAAAVAVPIDHSDPASAKADLGYELGAPYDPAKPTVLFVTDGQQFRVAPGRVAAIQEEFFGPGFNVVGIYGRGATEAFQQGAVRPDGSVDWARAWTIFRAEQWVEDLDAVRRAVVGPEGKVGVFGTSGGALLAHQYLARHGRHVTRAFTSATVEPWGVGSLGLATDRFWAELAPADRDRLTRALAGRPALRDTAMALLQRQNFFVPLDRLAAERSALIGVLEAGDDSKLAALRKEYQVDAIRERMDSPRGIAIRVREYEFAVPAGERERLRGPGVHPDLEVHVGAAKPLLDLLDAGTIEAPSFDSRPAHRLDTEVLVVAAHADHTVDWRTSIALAARYPFGRLFVADDDHMFARMKKSGAYAALIRAFLSVGTIPPEAQRHRWRE